MRRTNTIQLPRCHRVIRKAAFCTAVLSGLLATAVMFSPRVRAGGMSTLQIQHDDGILVVEPDQASRVVLNERNGLASADGSLVATSRVKKSRASGAAGSVENSMISVLNGVTGKSLWRASVPGNWRPEAMSVGGNRIVLGDSTISPRHSDIPIGRGMTTLLLLEKGQSPRLITLSGNFVAEAFSASGSQVVLIEHLPAAKPTSYRVRPLDLRTGALLPQQGAVKSQPTPSNPSNPSNPVSNLEATVMQGLRVNQSWSPSGRALYTLYDASPYGDTSAMFVHALNLDSVIATCLPVPESIDAGAGTGSVTWVNEMTLVVVGRRGMATIDARTGATLTTVLQERKGQATVAIAAGGTSIWVATGTTLEEVSLDSLRTIATYRTPQNITGMVPMTYGPLAMLDSTGAIWFAGEGVDKPILRGRVAIKSNSKALLVFP